MRRALFFLALALAVPAQAQTTYTWARGENDPGFWSDPNNWAPVGVPGADDTAVVGASVVVPAPVTVGHLLFGAGKILGDGRLTVAHSMSWTGGTLDGFDYDDTASIVIAPGATLAIRDGGAKVLRGRDLVIDGHLDWNTTDLLVSASSGRLLS